ncbi:hypothetical protein ACIQUQ_06040 [Streptomyces sp. NPDC101118]|uniref:hypothetical protein n=1 Tax=Streptomyces sp. NPDC101118 TaxID=3366109 RepID=UPI00382EA038
MDVPLWVALLALGLVGVKYLRPPGWLVVVLLVGGYLLADSFLSPAVDTVITK